MLRSPGRFGHRNTPPEHSITLIYDRVTDSSIATLTFPIESRTFKMRSRIWADFSLAYSGRRPIASPKAVRYTFQGFEASRGGRTFGRLEELRITSRGAEKLRITSEPSAVGPRGVLSFRIPTAAFVALAREERLDIRARRVRLILRQPEMSMIRELLRLGLQGARQPAAARHRRNRRAHHLHGPHSAGAAGRLRLARAAAADVVAEAASTGQAGDGMVFVLPVEEAIRISIKERGERSARAARLQPSFYGRVREGTSRAARGRKALLTLSAMKTIIVPEGSGA